MKLSKYVRIIPLLMITIPVYTFAQRDLIEKLDKIKNWPKKIKIQNQIDIEDRGGHLQGVQAYQFQNENYYYFSGSSRSYGYLAVSDVQETQRLHIIENKPLKHAGGFQIQDNWLAVGVEDNETRNTSQVQIYRLDNPMDIILEPFSIIRRNGERERATAGAVAVLEMDDSLLVLVGDWSNRHLDFYLSPLSYDPDEIQLVKKGEIDMINYPKEDWVEENSWEYQNINLIRYGEELYLFGFSSGPKDKNLMDVFILDKGFRSRPEIRKIYHRTFRKSRRTRFGWGAGISFSEDDGFTLHACGENILDQAIISVYLSKK